MKIGKIQYAGTLVRITSMRDRLRTIIFGENMIETSLIKGVRDDFDGLLINLSSIRNGIGDN